MPLLKKPAISTPTRDTSHDLFVFHQRNVLIELMSIEVKMVQKVPIFFCYNTDNDYSLENLKEGTNEVHKRPSVLTSKRERERSFVSAWTMTSILSYTFLNCTLSFPFLCLLFSCSVCSWNLAPLLNLRGHMETITLSTIACILSSMITIMASSLPPLSS